MPIYKNVTKSTKEFFGVTIRPNEIKFLPKSVICEGIVKYDSASLLDSIEKSSASKKGSKKPTARKQPARKTSTKRRRTKSASQALMKTSSTTQKRYDASKKSEASDEKGDSKS